MQFDLVIELITKKERISFKIENADKYKAMSIERRIFIGSGFLGKVLDLET
jgi:hypothetical protein